MLNFIFFLNINSSYLKPKPTAMLMCWKGILASISVSVAISSSVSLIWRRKKMLFQSNSMDQTARKQTSSNSKAPLHLFRSTWLKYFYLLKKFNNQINCLRLITFNRLVIGILKLNWIRIGLQFHCWLSLHLNCYPKLPLQSPQNVGFPTVGIH